MLNPSISYLESFFQTSCRQNCFKSWALPNMKGFLCLVHEIPQELMSGRLQVGFWSLLFSSTQMLDEECTNKRRRVGRQECCIYKKNYRNNEDKSLALSSSEKASHVRTQRLKRVGKKETTARIEEVVCYLLLGNTLALILLPSLRSQGARASNWGRTNGGRWILFLRLGTRILVEVFKEVWWRNHLHGSSLFGAP